MGNILTGLLHKHFLASSKEFFHYFSRPLCPRQSFFRDLGKVPPYPRCFLEPGTVPILSWRSIDRSYPLKQILERAGARKMEGYRARVPSYDRFDLQQFQSDRFDLGLRQPGSRQGIRYGIFRIFWKKEKCDFYASKNITSIPSFKSLISSHS